MKYLTPQSALSWLASGHSKWVSYAALANAEFAHAFYSSDNYGRAMDNWMAGSDEFLYDAFSVIILPLVVKVHDFTKSSDLCYHLDDAAAELASLVAEAMAEASMEEVSSPGWLNLQHNVRLIEAADLVLQRMFSQNRTPRWEVSYKLPSPFGNEPRGGADERNITVSGATAGQALASLESHGIPLSTVTDLRRSFLEHSVSVWKITEYHTSATEQPS